MDHQITCFATHFNSQILRCVEGKVWHTEVGKYVYDPPDKKEENLGEEDEGEEANREGKEGKGEGGEARGREERRGCTEGEETKESRAKTQEEWRWW